MTGPEEPGTAPRWLDAAEQAVWRDYLDVMRRLMEGLNRQLVDGSGMSLAEYEVLVQLSETPGRRLRMSELANLVVNSRSRLTHTVGRMEERGLVRRQPCPEDGRGVVCTLTDEGYAAIVAAAPGHVEMVRSVVFDALCDADVEQLGEALNRIRTALRQSQ